MIRHTFSVLKGVGERLERRLWSCGIVTWEEFLETDRVPGIGREKKPLFDEALWRFKGALEGRDSRFFSTEVRRREHWRLLPEFKGRVLCLDIETNGLEPGRGGHVTVVGFYDGKEWSCLVKGRDLTRENIQRRLDRYDLLVTFYGTAFDIPFLLRTIPGLRVDLPHFDLCFAARRLGLKGGLKGLERRFGIRRDESVQGLDGYDAVLLWHRYRRGSKEALQLLMRYNMEDTKNLLPLSHILYGMLRASTGIDGYLKREATGLRRTRAP